MIGWKTLHGPNEMFFPILVTEEEEEEEERIGPHLFP
jgi:hypothetical protein